MAAAAVSVEDELSCPICFELFVDPNTPKNLPCGHVLCEVCLKKMVEGKCQRTCAECRKIIRVPAGGILSFPTNFRLRTLAENHQKVGNNTPQGQGSPKKSGVPLCADHDDEKMHFYCVTCNSLACQACLILKHNGTGHNIEGIKEICNKQKREMKSAIIKAKSTIKEADNVLTNCKAAEIHCNELYSTEEKKLHEHTEKRVNELFEENLALQKQLQSTKQRDVSSLKKQTSSVEKQINLFKNAYQAAESATENLPDYEYITQHAVLVNKMKEIQLSKSATLASKTKPDVVKFVPSSSHTKLGHIISVTPGKVRTIKKMQTLGGFTTATRVDCYSDVAIAVADFEGEKLLIYHKIRGKYARKLDLKLAPKLYKPTSIAICTDGRLLVARSTCIEVYSPDGNHQNDIRINGSCKVDVNRVKITSDGRILVGDYNGSLIVEISPTGKVIRTIHTSIQPANMILIHDTHIAIGDADAGKVIVIDIESGQETLSIDITRMQGICYDEHTECLLIARSDPIENIGYIILINTGVIEQYSCTTGKLVACLQQGLYFPWGMALTSEGHLIVANSKTVEIYEIQ